jgi:hypothetical protein
MGGQMIAFTVGCGGCSMGVCRKVVQFRSPVVGTLGHVGLLTC